MGQSGATCSSLIGIRYERFAIVENLELCAGDSAPLHAETSVDSFLCKELIFLRGHLSVHHASKRCTIDIRVYIRYTFKGVP